jgi:hypothetical protein
VRWFKVADFNQFGSVQPSGSRDKADCTRCEALLADALDHTLSTGEQAVFDLHLATCADCTRMYMDARRGADWLVMLKTPQPEPSADLLQRILAATGPAAETQTAVQASVEPNTLFSGPMLVPAVAPAAYAGNVIPFRQRVTSAFRIQTLRHTFMQPRLAMTAAMAFFSIALTLNLTGVHITALRASDLKPSSLKRSFYDTNARVVRSIDNLRVVYEFESRVSDLRRRDTESTPAPDNSNQNNPSGDQKKDDQKAPEQQKQPSPRPRSGSSRSNTPGSKLQLAASASTPHETVRPGSPQPSGQRVQVSLHSTPNVYRHQQGGQA